MNACTAEQRKSLSVLDSFLYQKRYERRYKRGDNAINERHYIQLPTFL